MNKLAKKMNKIVWCKHINFNINGRYYCNGVLIDGFDGDIWDICPVKGCHAPRPLKVV